MLFIAFSFDGSSGRFIIGSRLNENPQGLRNFSFFDNSRYYITLANDEDDETIRAKCE